jgi:hypothetical protein
VLSPVSLLPVAQTNYVLPLPFTPPPFLALIVAEHKSLLLLFSETQRSRYGRPLSLIPACSLKAKPCGSRC